MGQVREYEARVTVYRQASGNLFDHGVRIAPEEVNTHPRLRVDGNTTYTTLRALGGRNNLARRPWTAFTIGATSDARAARGQAPIEVGAMNGKSRGVERRLFR